LHTDLKKRWEHLKKLKTQSDLTEQFLLSLRDLRLCWTRRGCRGCPPSFCFVDASVFLSALLAYCSAPEATAHAVPGATLKKSSSGVSFPRVDIEEGTRFRSTPNIDLLLSTPSSCPLSLSLASPASNLHSSSIFLPAFPSGSPLRLSGFGPFSDARLATLELALLLLPLHVPFSTSFTRLFALSYRLTWRAHF
jgi:hypothetical protein